MVILPTYPECDWPIGSYCQWANHNYWVTAAPH